MISTSRSNGAGDRIRAASRTAPLPPVLGLLVAAVCADSAAGGATDKGRELAFSADKGNCLACHVIPGGEQAGTIGPPLAGLRERYPDRHEVEALIHDASARNPASLMPPFGRHRILSRDEIARIVDFLYAP